MSRAPWKNWWSTSARMSTSRATTWVWRRPSTPATATTFSTTLRFRGETKILKLLATVLAMASTCRSTKWTPTQAHNSIRSRGQVRLTMSSFRLKIFWILTSRPRWESQRKALSTLIRRTWRPSPTDLPLPKPACPPSATRTDTSKRPLVSKIMKDSYPWGVCGTSQAMCPRKISHSLSKCCSRSLRKKMLWLRNLSKWKATRMKNGPRRLRNWNSSCLKARVERVNVCKK